MTNKLLDRILASGIGIEQFTGAVDPIGFSKLDLFTKLNLPALSTLQNRYGKRHLDRRGKVPGALGVVVYPLVFGELSYMDPDIDASAGVNTLKPFNESCSRVVSDGDRGRQDTQQSDYRSGAEWPPAAVADLARLRPTD